MEYLLSSILIFFVVAFIVTIVISFLVDRAYEEEPEEVLYMTEEEMEMRPIAEKHEKVEEEVEEVVPIDDGTFLYDIVPLTGEHQLLAERLCQEYHVSYAFFLAMCESESSFNVSAQGDSGRSVGLMQINKPNWDRYGLNAFVPEDNIEIGIRMMGELIEKYQEFDMVVMCYKAGEGKANELKQQGVRLSACDTVADATIWWEKALNECRGVN